MYSNAMIKPDLQRENLLIFSKGTLQRLTSETVKNGTDYLAYFKPVSSKLHSISQTNNALQKIPSAILQRINMCQQQFTTGKVRGMAAFIQYSFKDGEKETCKDVIDRFYRLNSGNWIRTIAGRHKNLWKKSGKRRRKNKEHVFCNATQCKTLDKMVHRYYRKPKYFIKSPYEPYEWREEFYITRKRPWRPEGCDYE